MYLTKPVNSLYKLGNGKRKEFLKSRSPKRMIGERSIPDCEYHEVKEVEISDMKRQDKIMVKVLATKNSEVLEFDTLKECGHGIGCSGNTARVYMKSKRFKG